MVQEEERGFCIDAVTTIQQILEETRECNKPLCLLFLDSEKACDKVDGKKLWSVLDSFSMPAILIRVIKSLYAYIT
jgi:hypothetical protein